MTVLSYFFILYFFGMNLLILIPVIIGSIGAGLATGLFGASAATVLACFLIVFANFDPYTAIGISLGVDVAASITVAIVYKKYGNVKVKPALLLLLFVFIGVLFGSFISFSLPLNSLAGLTGAVVALIGLTFILSRNSKKMQNGDCNREKLNFGFGKKNILLGLTGILTGIIAGMFGGGAGLTMFALLFFLLDYSVHKAVGTSVFIMIFIALAGSAMHFYYEPFNGWIILIGSAAASLGGVFSAFIANKLSEYKLRISIGTSLIVLGAVLFFKVALF